MKFEKVITFIPPQKKYYAQYKNEPPPVFWWSNDYTEPERITLNIPTDEIKIIIKQLKKIKEKYWESDGLERDEWIDKFTKELRARKRGT